MNDSNRGVGGNGSRNGLSWLTTSATVGHLLLALGTVLGSVVLIMTAVEHRLTQLEARATQFEAVDEQARARIVALEIETRRLAIDMATLVATNAAEHQEVINALREERQLKR